MSKVKVIQINESVFASNDRTAAEIRSAPPTLGPHNHQIYCDMLGLPEDAYQADLEKGVF